MATIAEKLTKLADTKKSIKEAIVAKGVAVADTDPFSAYPDKIGQIQAGGGGAPATKFGASVDTWIGDMDENGMLNRTLWEGALDFSAVKQISYNALRYKFYDCTGLTSVDFSSLQSVGTYGLFGAFYNCTGIKSVDFSSLQTIYADSLYETFRGCTSLTSIVLSSVQTVGTNGLQYMCHGCTSLTSIDFSSLTYIATRGLESAFYNCKNLTSVDLSSLQEANQYGMNYSFYGCSKLTTISFPSLTSIQTNSFGTASYSYAFANCTALTEIHFRADMQATIEAMTGYSNKWGATSSTIYFDLIGTITVNGVAYTRDEKQSIRVDGVKTFVGWKDADGNVVYTSYTDNAEPVVNTAVYSDQGITQVGTVEAVA